MNAAFVVTNPQIYVKTAAKTVKIAITLTAPNDIARAPLPSRPMAEKALTIATKSNAKDGLIPMSSALTPKNVRAILLYEFFYVMEIKSKRTGIKPKEGDECG